MLKNNKSKIDNDTSLIRGLIWAEDWNVLNHNFARVKEDGESEDIDRAIKNIVANKLIVINESLVTSNYHFNIGYFIAKGNSYNGIFL